MRPIITRSTARPDRSVPNLKHAGGWNSGDQAIAGTQDIVREGENLKPNACVLKAATAAIRARRAPAMFDKWRHLMIAAQRGESKAYDRLVRELDRWLRRYFARRLPAAAAEDARQDALLAIHARRHSYTPAKPFGPWVTAIARYKWIDQVRSISRFAAAPLLDDMPIESGADAALGAVAVDDLLRWLKPAQAQVIRLVKLDGASIADASGATGQSAALVKVNIHRGLRKLAALVGGDPAARQTAAKRTTGKAQRAKEA